MKCACSSASGAVGWLGVLVVLLAMILRVRMGQDIHLFWGIHTCASHLLLAANTLILLALFLRHQESSDQT